MSAAASMASPAEAGRPARRRIGVGVIGFGWLGQAHSRSLARIPLLFADRAYDPVLVAAATRCRPGSTRRCARSRSPAPRSTGGR